MKPRTETTDEEVLYCFFVRVSPILFGTNERPSAAGVLRMYGKKGGGDPASSAGQAQAPVIKRVQGPEGSRVRSTSTEPGSIYLANTVRERGRLRQLC